MGGITCEEFAKRDTSRIANFFFQKTLSKSDKGATWFFERCRTTRIMSWIGS